MLSLQGQALIAAHSLDEDDDHAKSVWVILDHTEDATTVFCLNRPVESEVEFDIRARLPAIPEGMRILRGGSFDGFEKHLIFVHRDPLKLEPAIELSQKFRVSMKHENVMTLTPADAPHCRIALGFTTWNPHQLEDEIKLGHWGLREIGHVGSTFFKVPPEELWSRLQAN